MAGRCHFFPPPPPQGGTLLKARHLRQSQARPDRTAKVVSPRKGAAHKHGRTANVICRASCAHLHGFDESRFPEQAQKICISERRSSRNVMLKDKVDGEFTTVRDCREAAVCPCVFFRLEAAHGSIVVVSHGWLMQ